MLAGGNRKTLAKGELVIESNHATPESIYIQQVKAGGKKLNGFTISHEQLVGAGTLQFDLTTR